MTNPNTARITGPMWRLWTDRPVATWRLGGIYANKRGYHNTVAANLANWPGDYSVRFTLDTGRGPRDKARAIDYTMSDSQMRTHTRRLLEAANRNDPRMRGVREFYGTVDGSRVIGRIRDNDTSAYRSSTSDSSHLWHIHISVWAAYCNVWTVLSGIISILRGETLAQWKTRGGGLLVLPRKGDGESSGMQDEVEVIQRMLVALGHDTIAPGGNTALRYDGEYGNGTEKAVNAFRADHGLGTSTRVTPWTYYMMVRKIGVLDTSNSSVDPEDIANAVDAWLSARRDELRGEDGKTPTRIRFEVEGQVTAVE